MVPTLLGELAREGIKLRLVGDQIQVTAPRGRLSPDLRGRIAAQKADLIAWLSRAQADPPVEAELPTVRHDPDRLHEPFPPSDLQTSFLMGSREGFEHYVRPHAYGEMEFDGLDPARFEKALNHALWRRRKSLVVVRDDLLMETVRDPAPLPVRVHDHRGLPAEEAQRRMLRLRAAMERKEPPLDRWPWLEAHVSLFDGPNGDRGRIHYNNNNLFIDAPGLVRLLTDALHHYQHPDDPLPEHEITFRDAVLALAELEESPLGAASKKYWCDRMADWPGAPELPLTSADRRQRSRLRRRELLFDPALWAALKQQASSRGLTLTNTLLAAHAEVLAAWSGSRHFLLNSMISHRLPPLHRQIGEVLGKFDSLYPVEVDWRHDESFHDRAHRLQAQVMADMQHSYWSGVKVLQTLNQVRRTPGRAVLPYAVGSALFVGQAYRPSYSLLETPQTMIDTEFWDLHDGRLWIIWDVIEEMFPEGLIDAMLEAYGSIVTGLAEGDAAWQDRAFDLLPAGQRRQRAELNRCDAPVPGGLLHDALPERAATAGDRPAVRDGRRTLSYRDLHRRGVALAGRLTGHGTRPGDLVAVVLPKGWEQIVAVFGALGADAAYVPIDPAWPTDRIRYLLADTAASAVLTSPELRDELAGLTTAPVLTVDDAAPDPAEATDFGDGSGGGLGGGAGRRRPEELAYVIYTSGSTGKPKGAMLDHRGPLNTVRDINQRFGIGADDVVFGVSSLCFDLSVYDVFGTVAAGATLVLPPPAQTDPATWIDLVATHGVTVWNSVPAIMQLFVEAAAAAGARFPALRTVLLSGDWIPVHLPQRIREIAPNARVISLGGATEASIWSICYPIERVETDWTSIPYGRPLANQTWHILDDLGRDVPTWVPGHLHIGGVGVALGYLNDADRTAASFVRHPRTGERLYRTGDLGRYLPGGDIEFLGRSDFQVKIQGFRVELGEIEHALLEHPDLRQATVVARSTGSGRQLAGFAVAREGRPAPEPAALRAFLSTRLPSYMVPSQLTVLETLPLTSNGKVDRRALERLGPRDGDDRTGEKAGPRSATETALVRIWESILDVTPIGIHDDFFELGGQSFAALRVLGQVAEQLDARVPLGTLLERRTVAELAEWLESPTGVWSPLVRLDDGRAADEAAPRTNGHAASGAAPRADGRADLGGESAPPWFLVHPAGGNVLCYRDLARLLDGPSYGLQAPGPASGQEPLEKVEDLADLYLRAVREVRPTGPYRLAGWSSGAIIAFELARQLEARGELVERVVVLDAPAPVVPQPVTETQVLLWFLEDLDVGFVPHRVPAQRVAELAELPEAERLPEALALLRDQDLPDAGLDPVDLAAALAVFRGVVLACNSYLGTRVDADITVIRASDGTVSEFAGHPSGNAPDWGWAALTRGRVDATAAPGTHHTLLTARNVTTVADAVNAHPVRPRSGG